MVCVCMYVESLLLLLNFQATSGAPCMAIHPHFCLHYINSRQTFVVVCLLDGTRNIGATDIVRKSETTFRCHQISSYKALPSKHVNVLEKTNNFDVTFNDLYQQHFPYCVRTTDNFGETFKMDAHTITITITIAPTRILIAMNILVHCLQL